MYSFIKILLFYAIFSCCFKVFHEFRQLFSCPDYVDHIFFIAFKRTVILPNSVSN